MRLSLAAVLGALTACVAFGQDAPETRIFEAGFLTGATYERRGQPLGLAQDSIGTSVRAGEELGGQLLSVEELAELIRRELPGAPVKYDHGRLVGKGSRADLDAVDAWLARARARYGRRLLVDAAFVLAPPGSADFKGARTLQSFRMSTLPGRPVVGQRIQQRSYLRDHDVQVSTGANELDPIIDVLSTGTRIDLTPYVAPVGDGVLFEIRAERSTLEAMEERTLKLLKDLPEVPADHARVVGKAWEARVELPRISLDSVRGQARGRLGETVVAASGSRADGVWALLLTASWGDAAPADPGAGARIYDVRGLTAKIQDFAGPRAGLVSPQQGGGGPLTGATFTLDEPRESYSEERLLDDVRAVVDAPGTPGETSDVERTRGDVFLIRSRHGAAEKVLAEAFSRETRTLTTEVAIVGFKARDAWAKILAAERSSVEAMAPLFEAARKGGDVRLIGSVSVTGRLDQLVYTLSGRQQAYVQDFEPQVSTYTAQGDPIIGVFMTGIGLQVRPQAADGAGGVTLDLRCWSLTGDVALDKDVSTNLGPVQRATVEGPNWDLDVACARNHWTLAALESREGEDWALFVRVKD